MSATDVQSNELQINYGGQAVLEGVMMRGRKALATAVRHPAGHIVLRSETLDSHRLSLRLRRAYFVRGAVAVWEMLFIGMRSLSFSARVQMAESDSDESEDLESSRAVTGSVILGLAIGVALFFVLPLVITSFADQGVESDIVSNVIEGGVRLAVFIIYIVGIGFMPDIRRVWMYHGAEHKTINALEAGKQLTVENVQRQSRGHPRCGTAFLVMLVVISIIVFAFLGRPPFVLRVLSRIALLPVIAGIGFEFIMLTARYQSNPLARIAAAPGMWFQKLTTREPDDDQVEVAIAAIDRVLADEEQLASLRPQAAPVVVQYDRPA
jgi:uncharacterized protein YqhQ